MQQLPCYLCKRETAHTLIIATRYPSLPLEGTPPYATEQALPLCIDCHSGVKHGRYQLELIEVIEADKPRYTH